MSSIVEKLKKQKLTENECSEIVDRFLEILENSNQDAIEFKTTELEAIKFLNNPKEEISLNLLFKELNGDVKN